MDYKKQAFYNTAGNLVYMGCIWLLSVATVRYSGYADAGVFSLAMSVGNIFYFIAMYGMRSFQASDTVHEFSGRVYFQTRGVTVGIGLFLCILYLCTTKYDGYTKTAIFLYLVFKCAEAGSDVIFGELQRVGHLEVCGISMSAKGLISVAVFSLVLAASKNINMAFASIIGIVLLFMVSYERRSYRKYRDPAEEMSAGSVKKLLKTGFPLLLTTVFPIVVTAVPRVELEARMGKEMLGIYASIATPAVLITTIVPNVLTPVMTYYGVLYHEKKYQKIWNLMWGTITATVLLGLTACIFAYFLGDRVMSMIFGDGVLPYMRIFIPLLLATTVYACSMCGNAVLITVRYPKWLTLFAGLALVFCLLIARPLVVSYGMMGTVWAFGIPFLVQLLLQVLFLAVLLLGPQKEKKEDPKEGPERVV